MTYLLSISIMVGLLLVWAFVQDRWKKTFPEDVLDDDALAGRSDCGNCGCGGGTCVNKTPIAD